jgi:hypothetical protein
VGSSFFRRLFAVHNLKDLQAGDAVRVVGYRGVAWVREVRDDHAVIVWAMDRRDILPLVSLRRVRPCGHGLDRRL